MQITCIQSTEKYMYVYGRGNGPIISALFSRLNAVQVEALARDIVLFS